MFVLSRKTDQSIVIDGQIKVTVIHMGRYYVRIGIDAPRDVNIRRGELVAFDVPVGSTEKGLTGISEEHCPDQMTVTASQ